MEAWRHIRAELPCVVTHHPEFVSAKEKWSMPYLLHKFGEKKTSIVKSKTNQFMYYNRLQAKKQAWDLSHLQTTTNIGTFRDFIEFVKNRQPPIKTEEHWYLMVNAPTPSRVFN